MARRIAVQIETVKVEFKLNVMPIVGVAQSSKPMQLAVSGQC